MQCRTRATSAAKALWAAGGASAKSAPKSASSSRETWSCTSGVSKLLTKADALEKICFFFVRVFEHFYNFDGAFVEDGERNEVQPPAVREELRRTRGARAEAELLERREVSLDAREEQVGVQDAPEVGVQRAARLEMVLEEVQQVHALLVDRREAPAVGVENGVWG